jgi:hypothetical protein
MIQGEDRTLHFGLKDTDEDVFIDLTGATEIEFEIAATAGGSVSCKLSDYSAGTASQSTNTITGIGTTFTTAMVGGTFVFADGTSAGTITAFGSATSLTVSVSQTKAAQGYGITFGTSHEIIVTDAVKGKFSVTISDTKSALVKLGERDIEVTVDWGTDRRIVQSSKAVLVVKRLF